MCANRTPLARLALTPPSPPRAAPLASLALPLPPPASGRGDWLVGEEAFGVDGGHAAGAGGGDRLTVDVVGDVAAGEHARDLRLRRAGQGLDVPGLVHVEQPLEQLRVRL